MLKHIYKRTSVTYIEVGCDLNFGEEKVVLNDDMIRLNLKSELRKLELRAKELKMLRFITNEILSNCSYADKNQEQQNERFDIAQVPQQQRDIIKQAWEFKKTMGELLMCDLKKFLDNYNVNVDMINNYLEEQRKVL